MFQIPTKIEPAYTAGNVLTLNQRKIQPALHRGNILSVNLKKTSSDLHGRPARIWNEKDG